MILETSRLRLRPMQPGDADPFLRSLNDWELQQWLAGPPYPYRREDAETFLELVRLDHEQPWPCQFVIADKSSDIAIGAIGIDLLANDVGEIGYWLDRAFWSKGYGKEAMQAMLRHAETNPSIRLIFAVPEPDNERSHRLLSWAGFKDCGLHPGAIANRRGAGQHRRFELAMGRQR